MKREEAIKFLTLMRKAVSNFEEYGHDKASLVIGCDKAEAIDMAIEALTEPINCVKCKHYYETEDDTDVHGHCRMDTAHTNPISKAVQGCDINKGAWLIPISLVALAVAVVGLLAEIHFLFL